MIRTLIVDDSGLMRLRIRDILKADKNIKVIGTANNGKEGLEAIRKEKPDVVITDMVMPGFDGLFLVKEAMKAFPLPIVLLSALGRNSQQVFDALELGAFAFLEKPRSERGLGFNKPLIELVNAAVRVNTDKLVHVDFATKRTDLDHVFSERYLYDIVVIGSSTGGPGAIETFILGLPSSFPVPIVIAQHMPPRFIESFATRLDALTQLKVKVSKNGEALQPNTIYLCSGETNTMVVLNQLTSQPIFGKTKKQYVEFNEPSVDCLFDSIAEAYKGRAVAVILTGMGKDGAIGMKNIKNMGSLTIAQDEKSSVIFGMPKAAIDEKAVDYILGIKEIPGFVTSCFS